MKRPIILACLVALSLGNAVLPSLADDPWFNKWDHNHDNRWDWKEFKAAHRAWEREHKEPYMSDKQLRAAWDSMNHNGYCAPDDVRNWHHW